MLNHPQYEPIPPGNNTVPTSKEQTTTRSRGGSWRRLIVVGSSIFVISLGLMYQSGSSIVVGGQRCCARPDTGNCELPPVNENGDRVNYNCTPKKGGNGKDCYFDTGYNGDRCCTDEDRFIYWVFKGPHCRKYY
mmetsp:Transcript_44389/g.48063  ORF Transcript_44389/g.48063 Transcript_44389/m.48063 type:complete len:134 (-) Transcript_44389:89-490(-)